MIVLLFALSAVAQRFEARLFGQEDALDNLDINALAQDRQGYLWVASQNGLFRYDGARFQTYSTSEGLTESNLLSLLVDHSGTLWVGSHNGLFWLDGNAFHELKFEQASLRVGTNSMLAVTSGNEMIVATAKGLFSVEPIGSSRPSWSVIPYRLRHPFFPKSDDLNGVGVDAADRLWLGCAEAICGFSDPGPQRSQPASRPFFQTLGKEQGVPPDYYVSFFHARDGRMYARGRKNIVTWKQGDQAVTDLTALFPPSAMKTIHRRFTEDAFGHVLTPTASGFATWDGARWTETISTSKGDIQGASEVFADREGALWIGTQGVGLFESLGYGVWQNYGTKEGLADAHVFGLTADSKGVVWAGHDKGLSRLHPGEMSFSQSPLYSDEDASQIDSLAPAPDGSLWAGSLLGQIFHLVAPRKAGPSSAADGGKVDIKTSIDAYIYRIRLDPAGTLWIGSNSGLYMLDCKPSAACKPQPVAGLDSTSIHDLALDEKGVVWAADVTSLYRVDRTGRSKPMVDRVAIPDQFKDKLKGFDLIATAPDGAIWVACGKQGVFRLEIVSTGGKVSAKVLEFHRVGEFVSTEFVSLDFDQAGRLWIGTDRGIDVLARGKINHITEDEGLIWNDIDSRAFLAEPDGSVWIGTSRGVSHLLNPAAIFNRLPFAATVDIFEYDGKPMAPGANIAWNGSPTTLRFSGLTFRDNFQLGYHYSLIGFDSTIVTTGASFVRFQKLPPGTYTFRVVAEDTLHNVFSEPAEYTFTLTPPWWRTKVFYAFLVLLVSVLVALLWGWSQRVLIGQHNKLRRLVAERTYELEQLAVRDSLTGLLNRNAILTTLATEIQNADKQDCALFIALIDLDHFKQINDTYGHLAGDEVLRRAAERLQAAIRSSDVIGRYGGEEFLIIFRNVEQQLGVEQCEVVRTALCTKPIVYESHSFSVTCSIGVAWSGYSDNSMNGLIAKADEAMYLAKEKGRNRTEFAKSA